MSGSDVASLIIGAVSIAAIVLIAVFVPRRRQPSEPKPVGGYLPGEVAPLDQQMTVNTRPEDGHTVISWTIRKGGTLILALDVRAEHARNYAACWTQAADLVDEIAPDQDWSYDPIRDAWENNHNHD